MKGLALCSSSAVEDGDTDVNIRWERCIHLSWKELDVCLGSKSVRRWFIDDSLFSQFFWGDSRTE